MWTSAGVALHRRPPAGKPPTTATREAANSALADCSSTLPHEAGRWHISGRSGKKGSKPDRPACAWPFRVGLPRQGTEVAHARPPCATYSRDCRAAVRSCSRALPRLGHRERGPAAGVLESLRAGADAKGPRGSLGKPGPRLGRLTSARRGTRCTAHRASASVPPAPGGGSIPVSGDMVSWLACCGNEVSCRCVPRRLVSAVLCSCRATASSHLHPGARIEWWIGRATSAPPGARRG